MPGTGGARLFAAPIARVRFACVLALVLLSGCVTVGTSVGRIVDPFNLTGIAPPPVRIGITSLELSPLLVPRAVLFEENLTFHLGRPVAFELMTPRQIRVNLENGRLAFAFLAPDEFCQIASSEALRPIAVPLNEHQQPGRKGLIVVSAQSEIQSTEELKGTRFHFLPGGNPLNDAALGVLLEAGVVRADLDRGILGLSLDTTHLSSAEVARSVILEGRSAGVIDEADYLSWPEVNGVVAVPGLPAPSRDMLRVIGETIHVPEGPFVASIHTEPELVEQVRNYLLNVLPNRKLVLGSLGIRGFVSPANAAEYGPFCEIQRRLHPERETTTRPATQPGNK